MGNRYGRNKRRRDRARIAGLEGALELDRQLLRYKSDRIEQQHEALSTVAEILGPNFIGLDVSHIYGYGQFRETHRMPLHRELRMIDAGALAESVAYSVLSLNAVALERRREELRMSTHLKVTFKDNQAAYFISDAALHNTPRDIFIRHVSSALAQELAKQVYTPEPHRERSGAR